jgi:ribosomal protein S18 acetylase RimI-like enzyme
VSVRLRPLREDEWPAFVDRGKVEYARDLVENGGFPPEAAEQKAEHDYESVLPDGLATEGQFIFAVEDAETGETVGRLWFARRELDLGEVAYVYDVNIDEAARGKGFGRAAMLALEEEVRQNGLERISLNVFGGNAVARGLYSSLGYRETAVWMSKDLSSEPSSPS